MADQIECPSCRAVLKYPPGATRLRCPQCKASVEVPGGGPPVAKAIPLPPEPVPKAMPLPFNAAKIPVAKPVEPPVAKAIPLEKPLAKGKVLREEPESEAESESAQRAKYRKARRKEYEESLKENKNYDLVAHHCLMGRIGLRLMGTAALLAVATSLFFSVFLITIAVATRPDETTLGISVFCIGAFGVALAAGYGFCCAGPLGMRGTAAIGIVVTFIHAGLIIPLLIHAYKEKNKTEFDNVGDERVTEFVYTVSGSLNNLTSLTDLPWMIYKLEIPGEKMYLVLMILGGLCEFMQIAILGTIAQFYASQGKGHELGFRSLKFVYRAIWVIAIVAAVKLIAIVGMDLFGGEAAARKNFRIPMTLMTTGYFLYWAFAWYEQFRAMNETADVVTPGRYLDTRRYLEDY